MARIGCAPVPARVRRVLDAGTDDDFPDQAAARPVRDARALAPEDILVSRRRRAQAVDRAHLPGARAQHGADRNGLAGMGFAVPAAIAATLVAPGRGKVVASAATAAS